MIDKTFLENDELSWKAKGILAYLLSKPDDWKVIVKDLVRHATDGKAAVYSGLNELKAHGHYQKIPVRDNDGRRISHWEGTISEVPMESPVNTGIHLLTDFQEIENQDIENQDIENREHSNNYINNNNFNNIYKSEGAHTPKYKTHGDHNLVRLTEDDIKRLTDKYGAEKTVSYVNRLDTYIYRTGKHYPNHYNVIASFIEEDVSKPQADRADQRPAQTKANRFINFKQREWDYDELERMEQHYIDASLEGVLNNGS